MRRPDGLRTGRGGASPGQGPDVGPQDPRDRRPRQSRLRGGGGAGDRKNPHGCRRPRARRPYVADSSCWLRGGALGAWGEPIIKQFVHEALQEVLKLESALARLKTPHRIALIHYAPVRDTVEGEPLEIYPFLGSSRFEEPLTRYSVSAVFHGHAHRGSPAGRTSSGIPVFNVCLPLLKALYPDPPPFRLFEVPRTPTPSGDDGRAPDLPIERRQGGRRSTDRLSGPGALVETVPPPVE